VPLRQRQEVEEVLRARRVISGRDGARSGLTQTRLIHACGRGVMVADAARPSRRRSWIASGGSLISHYVEVLNFCCPFEVFSVTNLDQGRRREGLFPLDLLVVAEWGIVAEN
jgi:hypothetical protein